MRRSIYRELEELERMEAAAQRAEDCRSGSSGVAMFRELLSRYAIEQLPGESLAETVARTAGISAQELKNLLSEQAQTIAK
jgi:hypothetical protein